MKRLLIIFSLFCLSAQADILLEPNFGVGYATNSASISNLNYNQGGGAPSGGLRVGYFTDYLFMGLDAKISYLILPGGNSAPLYTAGFGLGFTADFVPLRYYFAVDLLNSTQYQSTSLSAFGFRVGVGYYITESTMLNLEYQIISFNGSSGGIDATDNFRGFFAMLSFPMLFDYPTTPWRERYRSRQGPSSSDGGGSGGGSSNSGKDLDLE